jgi:hypothetical protein
MLDFTILSKDNLTMLFLIKSALLLIKYIAL